MLSFSKRAEAGKDSLTPAMQTEAKPAQLPEVSKDRAPPSTRVSSVIVGVLAAAIPALSIWYLIRPAPLFIQGEADATQFDIAARVDGRVGEVSVNEGQDVAAGAVLVRIDNPETIAKNEQALTAKIVAEAQLANSTPARERK
jgi:HlyD family secretion protein